MTDYTERARELTLEPDPHMRWIHDPGHRDYNSPEAEWLRAARRAAIRSILRYMLLSSLRSLDSKG